MGIAQLVRAPGCGPGGRRFKSGYSPFTQSQTNSYWFGFFYATQHVAQKVLVRALEFYSNRYPDAALFSRVLIIAGNQWP